MILRDHVICDSEFNRDDLLAYGLPAERLSVLHLPAPDVASPRRARSLRGRVELLFVGRFVRAKGVVDLLRAIELLHERGVSGFRVTLAGNQSFADPAVVSAVRRAAADSSGTVTRVSLKDAVAGYERDLIMDALKTTRGNRAKAARLLDTTERILNYKVRGYGIDVRRYKTPEVGRRGPTDAAASDLSRDLPAIASSQ